MKQRPPLLGYNHNVRHLEHVYHVQTEDSGVASARIFTHLFFGGTILASKRTDYEPSVPEEVVRALMRNQHKAMVLDLVEGRLNERIEAFHASPEGVAAARNREKAGAPPVVDAAQLVGSEARDVPPLMPDSSELPAGLR